MRVIDGLSKAQRVVVVVAIGLALTVAGNFLMSLGGGVVAGWYAYSPLTTQFFSPASRGLPTWLRLIIWLALIGAWALASVRVLRPVPALADSD